MVLEGGNMLKIDAEYKNNILYIRLDGNLNYKNSYKINDFLLPVITKYDIKYLVYNLRFLNNIDLKGYDAILNTKFLLKKNKGKIYLSNVGRNVINIFKNLKIPIVRKEKDVLNLIGE